MDYKVSWKANSEERYVFVNAENQGIAISKVLNYLDVAYHRNGKMFTGSLKVECIHD